MEESTLRWPTDKEREEMEEVCSIGEVPHTEKSGIPRSFYFLNSENVSRTRRSLPESEHVGVCPSDDVLLH